jgi:diguanylate cyclase (GGDEF)-like protein
MASRESKLAEVATGLDLAVELSAQLVDARSPVETLRRAAAGLAAWVHYSDLTVYELLPDEDIYRPAHAVGRYVDEVMADAASLWEGAAGWAMRTQRTRLVPDSLRDPVCGLIPGTGAPDETLVATPMSVHGRRIGALCVYRESPRVPFTRAEVAVIERVGALTGLAYDVARTQERLRAAASKDSLTGLLNHGAFHARVAEAVAVARRHARPLSVVVLDLDHFKRINDGFGHAEGDRVLRSVALSLAAAARPGDAAARIGGEEFAVLLPDTTAEQAGAIAERLRAAAATVTAAGEPVRSSAGVATWPADVADAATLLAAADEALYAAKRAGRDRSCRALAA